MHSGLNTSRSKLLRVLILGGTSEASQLITSLKTIPNIEIITSLAGRLTQPKLPSGTVRIGGFGGIEGLTSYLIAEHICAVVDATHPFAAKISKSAEVACDRLDIPLLAFERPPWKPIDKWINVPDAHVAASLIDKSENRVFLSIGRQDIGAFKLCTQAWFLIRTIDPPEDFLPIRCRLILERGPFHLGAEIDMLRKSSINILITKNSGGIATYPKIEAARELGIKVIVINRPKKHSVATISDLGELVQELAKVCELKSLTRSKQGT
ncbi:cobalt-precorrin-6A reductase [Granulicella arctica]|uniref:cobalt-precorrin-6A reductase n=1 Tax=Granulicella arctica TaxID=940613 RepID=UPI0021E0D657|nr:cobalt-precorrin-6A reductase [Granulicella arctica]